MLQKNAAFLAEIPVFKISALFWGTKPCLIEMILAPEYSLIHSLPKLKFGAFLTKLQVKDVRGECKFAGGNPVFLSFRLNLGVLNLV